MNVSRKEINQEVIFIQVRNEGTNPTSLMSSEQIKPPL